MMTEAQRGTGIDELTGEILKHRDFLLSSGTIDDFQRQRNQRHFMDLLRDTLFKKALQLLAQNTALNKVVTDMNSNRTDPYSAVEEIMSKILPDCVD
jgi:LAO/AO transport system kinase